jgi:NTE family protein
MKWLEENRVPVDLIAGTSMGGLVGALFAMGWTAPEVERMLAGLDWEQLLSGSPPYQTLKFRRKADIRAFPSHVELGLRNGLSAPSGLNPGHFIGLFFDRLALPYSEVTDFDELPIPFRCVATDLEDGHAVVLSNGGLAVALRATMAIPGVFNPVERNGRLLADGGLLENLPAKTAKTMGAEFVIAVQVGSPLQDREELRSFLAIADQSITIMMLENVRQSMRLSDILLTPDIGEFGTLEFGRTSEIVAKGYEAADQKRVLLESLSVSEAEWQAYRLAREARRRDDLPVPSGLQVLGVEAEEKKAIETMAEAHVGREVEPTSLEADLTSLYGSGRYYSVGYSVLDNDLRIRAKPKDYGPPFIRFGFLVDGSEFDSVKLSFRSRLSCFDLGGFGSELLVDASVGTPLGLGAEYYRPLGWGFFVAPRGRVNRLIADVFQEGDRIAEYRRDVVRAGIDLGYGFGLSRDEIRVGYEIGHTSMGVRIGQDLPLPDDGMVSVASLRYVHDAADRALIPRQGVRFEGSVLYHLRGPGVTENLTQLSAQASYFHRLSALNSLFLRAAGGSTIQNDAPFDLQFTLGGPQRLGAYSREELKGSRFFYAAGGLTSEIAELSLIVPSKVFVGAWYEVGSAFDRNRYQELNHSASAGIILDSFLGPLFLGGSVGDEKRGKIYFLLGNLF